MDTALVTGGCGFIGTHTSKRLHEEGFSVVAVDNLSRAGSANNREKLESLPRLSFEQLDVRDSGAMNELIADLEPDLVIHLAAQVAVTHSVRDPRTDFDINAIGTFNILEAARRLSAPPLLILASTNKVYGSLDELDVVEDETRWRWRDRSGINERQPLDFHSPYGCSKGAADQYWHDYGRIFGLDTVVCRQSCIYGPGQTGEEDQGWVAWFAIAGTTGRDVTVFGDGKQVRDLLHVDDLVALYLAAWNQRESGSGQVFNVGGGPGNTLSLIEYLSFLESVGSSPSYEFTSERPGDQKIFISDNTKALDLLGWSPCVTVQDGVGALVDEHQSASRK